MRTLKLYQQRAQNYWTNSGAFHNFDVVDHGSLKTVKIHPHIYPLSFPSGFLLIKAACHSLLASLKHHIDQAREGKPGKKEPLKKSIEKMMKKLPDLLKYFLQKEFFLCRRTNKEKRLQFSNDQISHYIHALQFKLQLKRDMAWYWYTSYSENHCRECENLKFGSGFIHFRTL